MGETTAIPTNPQNPGQVLACAGVLELALAEHGPVLSRFVTENNRVLFQLALAPHQVQELVKKLAECPTTLGEDDSVTLGPPFHLRLDWWLEKGAGQAVPKTWAGGVRPRSFFPAYQKASCQAATKPPRDWWEILDESLESASPGLDPREFTHALDTGFSTYETKLKTATYPLVQLLALIGLQRFRPRSENRNTFSYFIWCDALVPQVAALVFAGHVMVGQAKGFVFQLRARDQENRYKAFSFAGEKGGNYEQPNPYQV